MCLPADLVTVCVLAGRAGGGSLNSMLSAASASPEPDVLACARQQIKGLDFDQVSLDVKDYRVDGSSCSDVGPRGPREARKSATVRKSARSLPACSRCSAHASRWCLVDPQLMP
jgi:hypothetical protein